MTQSPSPRWEEAESSLSQACVQWSKQCCIQYLFDCYSGLFGRIKIKKKYQRVKHELKAVRLLEMVRIDSDFL